MSVEEENVFVYRSLSEPNISPTSKFEKLYVESIKINRNTCFRRQISCEIIYDTNNDSRESTIEILESPLKPKNSKKDYFLDFDETPSPQEDFDKPILSPKMNATNGKVNKETVSDTVFSKTKQLEEFLRKKRESTTDSEREPVKKKRSSKLLLITSFLIGLLSVGGYFLIYYYNYYNYLPLCKDKALQLQNIKKDLMENVTSQKKVVDTIISSFDEMGVWAQKIKVVPFIGSTGVGKTFIASLIKKHFDNNYVYELRYTNLRLNVDKFKSDCCNLLIIDNLIALDIDRVIDFIDKLPKNLFMFVVPIFNVQGKPDDLDDKLNFDDIHLIEKKFSESNLFYEIATFNFFTEDEVNNWLIKELKKYKLGAGNGSSLIKRLISETDINLKGLKGLHKEIFLELGKFYGKD